MANNARTALLCAYTLATAKHYAEAEALILSDTDVAKTPEALDLLARIRAEQGDVAEARRLWQEIVSLDPDNKSARRALRNLGKPPRRWWMKIVVAAGKRLAALTVGLGVGLVVGGIGGGTLAKAFANERIMQIEANALISVDRLQWPGIPTARDLAALPAWWAGPGDAVRASVRDGEWLRAGLQGSLLPALEWAEGACLSAVSVVEPWGWSPLLWEQVHGAGVATGVLPDAAALRRIRDGSCRNRAVELLAALRSPDDKFGREWGRWLWLRARCQWL